MHSRRRFIAQTVTLACYFGAGCTSVEEASAASGCPTSTHWPAWESFKKNFMSEGGRIIDPSSDRLHTVSEGQAYALFFALIADDRPSFERLFRWTENNLAGGDLTKNLPAWLWGRRDDTTWGVLDSNPASDADLWIAYILLEAGRLWDERTYLAYGRLLAQKILQSEVADLPGLGPTLLPGPQGFQKSSDLWRLNPSYVPVPLLHRLVTLDLDPRWQKVLESSQRLLLESAVQGFSPDWVAYQTSKGFIADKETEASGSYNAIRVYLWAGLMPEADAFRPQLLKALHGMTNWIKKYGSVPESIRTDQPTNGSDNTSRRGPAGFQAVGIPFSLALGDMPSASVLHKSLLQSPVAANAYYGQSLALFAFGWLEGRYAFTTNGSLLRFNPPACSFGSLTSPLRLP